MKLALRKYVYRGLIGGLRLLWPLRPQKKYRLIILKLDRLGDGVLSLGAVRVLMSEWGEERALMIVSPLAEALFRREFPAADFLVMPPFCECFWPDFVQTLLRHAAVLRSLSTDLLVCLRHQPSDYLHAIAGMIDARKTIASEWSGVSERTSLTFPRWVRVDYPKSSDGNCLELEAHRRLVEAATGRNIPAREVLPVLKTIASGHGGGLLICPVAGTNIREYPPGLLAEGVKQFVERSPDVLVSICLPPGSDPARWKTAMEGQCCPVDNWIFPEDVGALIQTIADADLVLGADSAPAHLAAALDKRGVFMLGGGHFGMFAPWGRSSKQKWLHHELACYQCRWNCSQPEPYCITRIEPAKIAQALWQVLE